ncbi:MAG TPA: GAF domain-containing sensor histidine kinase [Kiritimatiellia bacterium]|nr:GAF domain-containing sensor histidine kinase [Kiritimatiellia bacterium]HRZ13420.1 GAF domain-containing sensor histidine kinase [Kiritimatiellia bacterium]HSA18940.1 GAF domain-containing sensor histidine kinase [Kiritimatiellia bacterium]
MTGPDRPENIYEALLRVSLDINARLELTDVLEGVIRHTRLLLDCEDASLVLWDARRRQFETGASTTRIGGTVATRVRQSGGATRWIVDHGQPCLVPDTRKDPFTANPIIPENGIGAYAGVPVRQGDEVLGVLYALSRRTRGFSDEEVEWMKELAGMAAIAIQNSRLMASLRELNEFKDALRRMAAHDLRQPLSPAIGYLDLALTGSPALPREHFALLEEVRKALMRMRDLVSGILDYERVTEEGELVRQPVDLNAVANEALRPLRETAASRSQRLEFSPVTVVPPVAGDLVLLRQAMSNLVANAIKYTPHGGRIAVATGMEDGSAFFQVRDNGPGIDPEDQKRLFQPFTRLKSAGDTEGTGLGLSLVRKIVERHGGRVSVDSAPGRGSLFRIHLPIAGNA